MKLIVGLIFLLLPIVVQATTWVKSEVDDPIFEGKKCSVQEPASFGSYIYSWPSKYDQVFWPSTEQNGIWFCEESGFTALMGDFSDMDSTEVEKINDYLLNNPPADSTIESKLNYLEKIYSLRVVDDAFNNRLLRILARWYQDLGNIDKANQYREGALEGIELGLKGDLGEGQRLEYLYLAANYNRQFGNEKASDAYLLELSSYIDTVQDENIEGYAEYLKDLSKETKFIKKGGLLDPELPEEINKGEVD